MPIPKPTPLQKKNNDKQGFIQSCMADKVMNREYDQSQRYAICENIWRDRNKQKSKGETVKWTNLEDDDRGFLLI